ncbi:MAG: hypothetical protein FJZ90_04375 [Chloroflexi bacterium]|nr:hypothetical protein [Chloroflexota bacterium]
MTPIAERSPQVAWLDEELRKDKALIAELRDLVDKQQVALVDQTQRILALEDRLAKLTQQLMRVPELEEALGHTRDELVILVNELRQEQQKRETDFLRNRQSEREHDLRTIQSMQVELQRFEPLEQGLAVRQAEDRRLTEIVLRMQQDAENLARKVQSAEEWRRQTREAIDKNAAGVGQIQQVIEELKKAQQGTVEKILILQNALPRYDEQLKELQSIRQEVTAQQEELLEAERRAERARAQTMTEWGRKMEEFAHQLEVWTERMLFYNDQHDKNRRVLREIQELAQEVAQQQERLRQVQRVAEEQLRRELRESRGEVDRRLNQEMERRERIVEEQAQKEDAQNARLANLEQLQEGYKAALAAHTERLSELKSEFQAESAKLREVQRRAWQSFSEALQGVASEIRISLDGDSE